MEARFFRVTQLLFNYIQIHERGSIEQKYFWVTPMLFNYIKIHERNWGCIEQNIFWTNCSFFEAHCPFYFNYFKFLFCESKFLSTTEVESKERILVLSTSKAQKRKHSKDKRWQKKIVLNGLGAPEVNLLNGETLP